MNIEKAFTSIANTTARVAGKPIAFVLACLAVVVWAVTGPLFDYSDTWQLVINTATTILTFLMVFVLQNSQNRDGRALQAKLDELLRSSADARDDLERVEDLTEAEIEELRSMPSPQAKPDPHKT